MGVIVSVYGSFSDQFGVEDFRHQQVEPLLDLHLRRSLVDQVDFVTQSVSLDALLGAIEHRRKFLNNKACVIKAQRQGSTSMATTLSAPSLAAIMASKPVPVPMSSASTGDPLALSLAIALLRPS